MKPLQLIFDRAIAADRHIVLAEGEDPRIQAAAIEATRRRIARLTLLGRPGTIESGVGAGTGIEIIDPASSERLEALAAWYHGKRRHKGVTEADALQATKQPLNFAALMVDTGQADGTVAGAVATTADTVRAALTVIGRSPGTRLVSSFFLMLACRDHHPVKGGMVFSDCGLVVDPDAADLAAIARSSASSVRTLLGETPRLALLSFSTAGSAEHARVAKVREALRILNREVPGLLVDGEMQFDAAFEDSIRKSKAPASALTQRPNAFIFPNLDAGNIGYKIAQRIGGMQAIGPILQGLAKPANDLSRGCTVEDVLGMIAVTAVQAAERPSRSQTSSHGTSDDHGDANGASPTSTVKPIR